MTTVPALLLLALALPTNAEPSPPPIIQVTPAPPPVLVPLPPSVPRATPAPAPNVRIVRLPDPRRQAQTYVTPDDYPASALATGAEGRVAFILDVGPDGRAHGCTITRSSGSSALDSATCRIMVRRARFTPAIDSNGNPAPGRVSGEVEWQLPAATERG